MQKRKAKLHNPRRLSALLVLALLLALTAVPALGDADSAALTLPVRCEGPGCTVALLDAEGNLTDRVTLPENGSGAFHFRVTGLGVHVFTARVSSLASATIRYDPVVFTVYVNTVRSPDGSELLAVISVRADVEGKTEELVFENEPIPGPGPLPTPTPTPGPDPTPTPPGIPVPSDPPGPAVTGQPAEPGGDGEPEEDIFVDDVPLGPLPQTGQLWWPVPVLGVLGLSLLLAGILETRRRRNR